MFDIIFSKSEDTVSRFDSKLNGFYTALKEIYNYESVSEERKNYLTDIMNEYGYLNYPHIKALEELSPAETLFCLEFKWKNNGVFSAGNFLFENNQISVLQRNKIRTSDWICKEGHEVKLINLPALSNGNNSNECAKFIDWLKQLLILPTGNMKFGILDTTMYLVPFHPRDFGCAYLPLGMEASDTLYDSIIGEKTGMDVTQQVVMFIKMAQLAGHPVIYDILPQISRFSKYVLLRPFIARWFDINDLISKITNKVDDAVLSLANKYSKSDIEIVKELYKELLNSGNGTISEHYKEIYDAIDSLLLPYKKEISNKMAEKSYQEKICKRVEKIISKINGKPVSKMKSLSDLVNVKETVETLIKENLWPLPGGAWCSSGMPVFDKMSESSCYPMFLHFNKDGNDVTEFANLDCQTPIYFAYLDKNKYNEKVIDTYIEYLDEIQKLYNVDGFRVDHVDHIVDEISQNDGFPISYRCPSKVLGKVNSHFKKKFPYFSTLAEYMLWDKYYKEYHIDMKFDLLWGDDIVSQSDKTPAEIIKDNQYLANFNIPLYNKSKLSVLKTYNNQDGEFVSIDRYPAQLGESGAMYKWFKYKFLPGGKFASRPMMYVDGDESFTQVGIEHTITNEVPMKREKNYYFYAKFDAISRFVKTQDIIINGEAQIIAEDNEGFATWMITKEPLKQAFLIISNCNSPFEKFNKQSEDGTSYTDVVVGQDIYNKTVNIPGDYAAVAEYVFDGKAFSKVDFAYPENSLTFPTLYPGEFKIFVITK